MKYITLAAVTILVAGGSVFIYKQQIAQNNTAQVTNATNAGGIVERKNGGVPETNRQYNAGATGEGCPEEFACNQRRGTVLGEETQCVFGKYIVMRPGGQPAREAMEEDRPNPNGGAPLAPGIYEANEEGVAVIKRPTKALNALLFNLPLYANSNRNPPTTGTKPRNKNNQIYDVGIVSWKEQPGADDAVVGQDISHKVFWLGGKELTSTQAAAYKDASACHIDNTAMLEIEAAEAAAERELGWRELKQGKLQQRHTDNSINR